MNIKAKIKLRWQGGAMVNIVTWQVWYRAAVFLWGVCSPHVQNPWDLKWIQTDAISTLFQDEIDSGAWSGFWLKRGVNNVFSNHIMISGLQGGSDYSGWVTWSHFLRFEEKCPQLLQLLWRMVLWCEGLRGQTFFCVHQQIGWGDNDFSEFVVM